MSEPQVDPRLVDQTRKEISRLISEIEHFANQELAPAEFYAECMRRVYTALAARAVALWMRTPQGNLQLQFQVNVPQLGLDESSRPAHDELLRYVVNKQESTIVGPASGPGELDAPIGIQNPTPFLLVLSPIIVDGDTLGVAEVFQDANRRTTAQQGYLQFLRRVVAEIAKFIKNGRYRIILGQQAQWNQVESFIRTIHGGLNPTQVAYLIANEGKRLIQCERVSVAIRRGKKAKVVAISGQDVVEQRSNLVRRLTGLVDKVMQHGENLVYNGQIHEHWPGDVRKALLEYLEESGSKLIIIIPMSDTREFADRKGKSDSALICEMIEDPAASEEIAAKVEVVSRHSSIALANALEHQDIFLLGFWKILGRSTRWARGRGMPKLVAALVLLAATAGFLTFYRYPLRLEGRGELVPEVRRIIYAPISGDITKVFVDHGDTTEPGSVLASMSSRDLTRQQKEVQGKLEHARGELQSLIDAQQKGGGQNDPDLGGKIARAQIEIQANESQLKVLDEEMKKLEIRSPITGAVMDWKPKEKLLDRPVKEGDPLLEVAAVHGRWLVEVEFPESVVTHIKRAQSEFGPNLKVEYVLTASPDTVHRGRLIELASQAKSVEQENFVEAKIEIDDEEDIFRQLRQAAETTTSGNGLSMVSGIEVRAKVDCGKKPLGYVLFRELIDFFREYVFF